MTPAHWRVLVVYLVFTLIATLLALARRWIRPNAGGESVWHKYPAYILINLIFLAAIWLPQASQVLTILLSLLGGLAAWELSQALLAAKIPAEDIPLLPILYPASTLALIALAGWSNIGTWSAVWLATLFAFIGLNTLSARPANYPRRIFAACACIGYLPICLAAFVLLRQSDAGGFLATFLYLVIATNDALAQITGQLIGTRPLAPYISPAKTVEGALGGILFAGAMGAALASTVQFSFLTGGILGLVLGAAGLIGDLTASAWKRALGLRNFSSLLGAQGGILDRFDGLLFAAPVFILILRVIPGS